MFELVAVNRLDVREQVSLRRFNNREEAVREARARQQSEPLIVFYVFLHLSPVCRVLETYTGL